MLPDLMARFVDLFIGNDRSYGNYAPTNSRMWTTKDGYTTEQFGNHLDGSQGLGLVPILDDGTCRFAALDIDAHEAGDFIELEPLEASIRTKDLPLTVCRSKSGGAHCYLFLYEQVPCNVVRPILTRWAIEIGHPGVEVFPKQGKLLMDNQGERALGNWINLPYFKADDTERYAVEGGDRATFEFFLESAESRRVGMQELQGRYAVQHPEAPPCFQRMLIEGVRGEGSRNNALYNATIYLKRGFPDDWKDRAFDFNQRVLDKPLPHGEAKKTITSAARRDYTYKCAEAPICDLCDRDTCVTREFGIAVDDPTAGNLPKFSDLKKYQTDPVRWEISVNEVPVIVSTPQLMRFNLMREVIAEHLHVVAPKLKDAQWGIILGELMPETQLIEVPDEASVGGLVRAKLADWLNKADLSSKGDNIADREALLRGVPVVQRIKRKKLVMFRGADFVDYLKKTRSEELKGPNLWMALKQAGVGHTRLRINDKTVITAWYVGVSGSGEIKILPPEFDLEF